DVIALHQAELRNTVGLMGTALTDEQVGELARLAPTVLLALDADSAGQDAMLRAARVATRQRLTLRVVPLPVDADPADLVQAEGASAILARVEASVPFVRFRVERELERGDLTTAEGRGAVISALRPLFAELTDEAVRQELLRLVCDRTDLSPNILSPELPSRGRSRPLAPADNTAPALGRALSAAGRAERTFLAHAVALPQAGRAALADLDIEDLFTEETNRRAALHLREHLGSPTLDSSGVDAPLSELLAELAVAGVRPSAAALEAETLKLKIRSVERKIKEAQHAQSGDVAALVTRRHELGRERDAAIARAMEETAAAR
ncbi:MAG TPA: toprim domain-containing protein, partial [Solirubrobacteraceae bacterium]|nr:toprim domain-containing protein [Solirubrobacteraceae bacterium]